MTEEIQKIVDGYKEFKKEYFQEKNHEFKELVDNGQKPKILVIACSDSRVDPAIVTNSKPGDLFVIRNVANLVPPYEPDNGYHGTSAALEFGVCMLKVEHIIIFGHTQCGGINSIISPDNPTQPMPFIKNWMQIARPTCLSAIETNPNLNQEKLGEVCGQHSLINSLKNLKTFPWINEKVAEGTLSLHAWNFDLPTGTIQVYKEDMETFSTLDKWSNKNSDLPPR